VTDKSNGYEAIAPIFIPGRGTGNYGIGADVVAQWSTLLPPGATVLDLGCGTGQPISQVFLDRGFQVYGIDASPSMVAAFRQRFPDVPIQCAAVEESDFFNRTFDAVVSWGLFFLLTENVQRALIPKIAKALRPGGRLLFTSTCERWEWLDAMTDLPSLGLGYDEYRTALESAGLQIVGTDIDVGDNFHYSAQKISP
jgi:SAM-dependent methyltransferase